MIRVVPGAIGGERAGGGVPRDTEHLDVVNERLRRRIEAQIGLPVALAPRQDETDLRPRREVLEIGVPSVDADHGGIDVRDVFAGELAGEVRRRVLQVTEQALQHDRVFCDQTHADRLKIASRRVRQELRVSM